MKIKFFTIFGAIMSVIVIWFCLYISPDKSFNYIAGTIFCGGGGCFVFNFLLGVIVQAFFPDKPKPMIPKGATIGDIQGWIDEIKKDPECVETETRRDYYCNVYARPGDINLTGLLKLETEYGVGREVVATLVKSGDLHK